MKVIMEILNISSVILYIMFGIPMYFCQHLKNSAIKSDEVQFYKVYSLEVRENLSDIERNDLKELNMLQNIAGNPKRKELSFPDITLTNNNFSATGSKGNPGKSPTFKDEHDNIECSDLHTMNITDVCAFVTTTDDCQIDEGFIDYTNLVYCSFSSKLLPLALLILFVWWLFLFVGLGATANDFFCPSLTVIADTMHLSHNIAICVTFLAFGNGAPDIFSAIAAIGNAKDGDAGMAFGALLGAGVFVTTVVAGTIAIICPFDCMQRPFLRDVIFFIAALFYTFVILWDKKITKIEAIGFILMYVVYVLVVVIGRFIYTRNKNRTNQLINCDSPGMQNRSILDEDGLSSGIQIPSTLDEDALDSAEIEEERQHLLHDSVGCHIEAGPYLDEVISPWGRFFRAINPIDTENWSQMKIYKKVYEVFKSPLMFFLMITIPVVDYEAENHNWNRYLSTLQCFTGPVFCIFATKVGFNMMGSFPVWALVMILAFCLAVLVFITSKNDIRPKLHSGLAYLGFLVAVIWIYSIANEIVNILQTFGIAFSISNAILGLTLLAWGNSIGDFIADIAMARQGYPRMGISACFGGPLFNLLLGVGIPFTIGTIKKGDYQLKLTLEEIVLAAFLAFSLVTSLIIVTASKFRMSRPYGLYLMALYVVFLVVAILTETGTIRANIN